MKIIAFAALLGIVAPAAAAVDTYVKIPAPDQKMVAQCKAMKHDAMLKSPMCQKMMRLYPAAFVGSASSN